MLHRRHVGRDRAEHADELRPQDTAEEHHQGGDGLLGRVGERRRVSATARARRHRRVDALDVQRRRVIARPAALAIAILALADLAPGVGIKWACDVPDKRLWAIAKRLAVALIARPAVQRRKACLRQGESEGEGEGECGGVRVGMGM